MNEIILGAIFTIITVATPLILATMGEIIVEKAGVLNLGVEGMMLMGAVMGFYTSFHTQSVLLGFGVAALVGVAMSMIFALLVLKLYANQVAAGLALSIFGLGLSTLIGQDLVGKNIVGMPTIMLNLDGIAVLTFGLVGAIWWFLTKTKGGLILRAVGEDHDGAHALGYNIVRIRLMALGFGGMMAGLAGAYLSLVYTTLWAPGMTAGRGWIALALVVFAAWRPFRALFGAFLFGGITIIQLHAQGFGVPLPSQLLSALPYVVTIIALIILSSQKKTRLKAPKHLGVNFIAH